MTTSPSPSAAQRVPRPHAVTEVFAHLRRLGGVRRRRFALVGATALAGGVLEAALIFLVIRVALAMTAGDAQFALDVGPVASDLSLRQGLLLCGLLIACSFLTTLLTARTSARIAADAVQQVRQRAVRAFLRARWEVQSVESPAQLQEQLSSNVFRLGNSATFVSNGIVAALNFVAFLVSAVVITPLAALVMVVGLAVFGVLVLPLTRVTRRLAKVQTGQNHAFAGRVSQVVALAREARVFDVGDAVRADVVDLSAQIARTTYSLRLLARLTPAVYQLVALGLLVGGLAAVDAAGAGGVPSLGAVVVLLVRAISYGQQINTAAQACTEMAPYLDDLARRLALYEDNPVVHGDATAPPLESLRAESVSASYVPGRPVLSDVDVEVVRGETVGIVGPSGGGKSTLLQVVLRLREPASGRLLLNGRDVREFDLSSWFGQVAFVPQDNHLLPGTVAENIRFYRAGLDDAAVLRAARLAHLHEDVVALPDGYDTRIGPGARDLSGGQKQRLGLARALAGDPSVLVLDEPTSALDMRSEALIQQTLADLTGDVTCLIVAHRLSTLASCTRVLVVEGGRITASGPPEEVQGVNRFFAQAVELSRGS